MTKEVEKCEYKKHNGKKYLVPNCLSVVHSLDIRDCVCIEETKMIIKQIRDRQ